MTVTVKRGEIWRACVPYNEDPANGKERFVVVLGASPQGREEDEVVLVAPITSFGDGGRCRNGDVPILNWRNVTGLNKASWIRARRVWGANPNALVGSSPAGSVETGTMDQVLATIAEFF
ncbi:type II toxin-antitoxin system PemK/MazF family toxin [Micrococcus terreus]|uniref:type II toxin-antitoxin system PemK/MazF family toxin n=1 Tax=Micrococcus terreus TaxID=574650 RepID=UPI003AFB6963